MARRAGGGAVKAGYMATRALRAFSLRGEPVFLTGLCSSMLQATLPRGEGGESTCRARARNAVPSALDLVAAKDADAALRRRFCMGTSSMGRTQDAACG